MNEEDPLRSAPTQVCGEYVIAVEGHPAAESLRPRPASATTNNTHCTFGYTLTFFLSFEQLSLCIKYSN